MNRQTSTDVELQRERRTLRWPLRAKIVLEQYRLSAQDLEQILRSGRAGFATKITNVSLEGVEELHVLLHMQGLSKPLRLTPQQRQQISNVFQSHHFADWIEHPLELSIAPSRTEMPDGNHIALSISSSHTSTQPKSRSSQPNSSQPNSSTHQEIASTSNAHDAETPQPTPHRIARTHFSGAGEEFSVSDSGAGSKRRTRFGRANFGAVELPAWLQQIGQLSLLRQLRTVFDTNLLIALLLFLIVVAAVQFEAILSIVAALLGR